MLVPSGVRVLRTLPVNGAAFSDAVDSKILQDRKEMSEFAGSSALSFDTTINFALLSTDRSLELRARWFIDRKMW